MLDVKGVHQRGLSPLVKRELMVYLLALLAATALLLVVTSTASAQGGQIAVEACLDQNADGICAAYEVPLLGAEACLNDETTCQSVPAVFADLPAGEYTPFLRFTGTTLGYYPTTPRTSIDLTAGESTTVELGAVYPVHPKGVAVHEALNKVYVAFQGPVIDGIKPHPFVAVIDGETDQVLRTIPGGENGSAPGAPNGMGVGREPWGVAVSGNGEFVYVGSFGDGIIAIIDPETDTVITNISPGAPFKPTAPMLNPITGRVHFPDYAGGRVVILNDDPASFPTGPIVGIQSIVDYPKAYSPFEMAIVKSLESYNFVTLRDASPPYPFKFVGFNTIGSARNYFQIMFNTSSEIDVTGSPHAVALWQDEGADPRLFITFAADPRKSGESYPNPNRLLLYDVSPLTPDSISLRRSDIGVGDYAEVGLVYNPRAKHMLGTYAGFAYDDSEGDAVACAPSARGGTYALDYNGDGLAGDTPSSWKLPSLVVGNPPYIASGLQWRNPFEIAVNPNNDKVYVTDRCWNDYPTGGQVGGGAVLIFTDTSTGPTPTPTVTGTPPTSTPTVTGTPPTSTPTVTGTPPTATPTITETPTTPIPTITGTPPTPTPTVTGTPPAATPSVTGTPPTPSTTVTGTPPIETPPVTGTPPTPTPSVSPTPEGPITLAFAGPSTVTSGDTFDVAVQALDVTGMGLYGAQLVVNYDPNLISVNDLQINPNLTFVVLNTIDNTAGKITFLASRQGQVPGLLGDVTLLTFEATAIGLSGQVTFTFTNEVVGDPLARPFDVITQDYTVVIEPITTPEPTVSGTPSTGTPSVTETPSTGTPGATETPSTGTPGVTETPSTGTPAVTETPSTGTPTGTPPGDLTMFGLVYDALGGPTQVIPNAGVSVLTCQSRRFLTLTGVNGTYSLLLPAQYLNACEQVTLEATATGYHPISFPVLVSDLRSQPERNFALMPLLTTTATPTPSTGTPSETVTPSTGTPDLTGTPSTGTPSVTAPPPTDTPSLTGTPSTGTPGVTETPSTGTPGATATPSTGTPSVTETPSTGTPSVTETPSTGTPSVTAPPPTDTPGATATPSTGTPGVTETPSTGTPGVTETPSTGTPSVTGTPPTGTPTVTGTPPTVTPGVTVIVTITGTPGTGMPTVTGTPSTGTPSVTGTPPTGTPTVTGTPPTVTPGVTVIVTITGTPGTGTPTVTGTPPTATPTATGTPPSATPTVTGTPPSVTPGVTVVVTLTGTPSAGTPTPVGTSTPSGPRVIVIIGQVSLPGRTGNDWSGATVAVEAQSVEPMSVTTNDTGEFALTAEIPPGDATIKADAPGYLPAICNLPLVQPEARLANTALLSGDINDDDWVDITDAVAIGLDFGSTDATAPADINRSGNVDVLDVILVGVNFGESTQVWPCRSE